MQGVIPKLVELLKSQDMQVRVHNTAPPPSPWPCCFLEFLSAGATLCMCVCVVPVDLRVCSGRDPGHASAMASGSVRLAMASGSVRLVYTCEVYFLFAISTNQRAVNVALNSCWCLPRTCRTSRGRLSLGTCCWRPRTPFDFCRTSSSPPWPSARQMHSFDSDDPSSPMYKMFRQVCAVGALMNLIAPTFVDASNPMATTPKVSELNASHATDKTDTSVCLSVCVSARGVQGDALGLRGFWQHLLVFI